MKPTPKSKEGVRVVGFNGSPLRSGQTTRQLRIALTQAEKLGATTKEIFLPRYAKLYHGDFSKNLAPSMAKMIDEIIKADAVIFATPVHWFAPSGYMKCLLDALSYLEDYAGNGEKMALGKVAGFIAVYGEDGGQMAIAQMASVAVHSGFTIPPWGFVFYNKFIAPHSVQGWQVTAAKEMAKRLVETVTALKSANYEK